MIISIVISISSSISSSASMPLEEEKRHLQKATERVVPASSARPNERNAPVSHASPFSAAAPSSPLPFKAQI